MLDVCSYHQAGGEAWGGANSIAIVAGSAQADLSYLKSSSLQLWLFAYELPGARRAGACFRLTWSYTLYPGLAHALSPWIMSSCVVLCSVRRDFGHHT